jgi:dTMP kinase
MQRGVFVSFESSEGCGKSTQIARLRERLTGRGLDFLVTREPGGTAIGEKVRDLLQYAPEGEGMTSEAELLLFAASRAQLVREVIEPALAAGRWVLADRFLDSTTVYQGGGRELNAAAVESINRFAVGDCIPDLTLVLDMDVEAARKRALAASGAEGVHDRMEHLDAEFYQRVRDGYRKLVEQEPQRMKLIEADATPEKVAEDVWAAICQRFEV